MTICSIALHNTTHQIESFPFVSPASLLHPPSFFSFFFFNCAPSVSVSPMTLTDRLVATGTTPRPLCNSEAGRCEIHNSNASDGICAGSRFPKAADSNQLKP